MAIFPSILGDKLLVSATLKFPLFISEWNLREKVPAGLSVLKPEPQSILKAGPLVSDLSSSCSNMHSIDAGQQLPAEQHSYGRRSDLIPAEHG